MVTSHIRISPGQASKIRSESQNQTRGPGTSQPERSSSNKRVHVGHVATGARAGWRPTGAAADEAGAEAGAASTGADDGAAASDLLAGGAGAAADLHLLLPLGSAARRVDLLAVDGAAARAARRRTRCCGGRRGGHVGARLLGTGGHGVPTAGTRRQRLNSNQLKGERTHPGFWPLKRTTSRAQGGVGLASVARR